MTGILPAPAAVGRGDITCVPVGGDAGKFIRVAERWAADASPDTTDPRALAIQHVTIQLGYLAARTWTYQNGRCRDLAFRGWTEPGWYVAEALTSGAHIRLVGQTAQDAITQAGPDAIWTSGVLALTPTQGIDIADRAIAALGTPYGFADYLWIAIKRHGIPFPGLDGLMADPSHLICSQYADWSWKGVRDLFADGRPIGDVMPSDIAALVLSALGT